MRVESCLEFYLKMSFLYVLQNRFPKGPKTLAHYTYMSDQSLDVHGREEDGRTSLLRSWLT